MKCRPKICTAVSAKSLNELGAKIKLAFDKGSDYVEVRVDHLHEIDLNELGRILKSHAAKCVLTCRPIGEGGSFRGCEEDRLDILMKLSELRPAFLDVELNLLEEKPSASFHSVSVIGSYHNFHNTPTSSKLFKIMKKASETGNYVKIITTASTFHDNLRIMSLYRMAERGRLIAFCMGEQGIISRILSPLMGSPFTYASLGDEATAPGQIPIDHLRELYDKIRLEY